MFILGGECEPCGSLTEVGSIIDQVSSWKILWKLSHIEVVLPGGLLLPPPEVNFGVVGIWDIPEDQAQGSSSVTLRKDVVENLWSVHTYIYSSRLPSRQTTYQVTPFALCVCVCVFMTQLRRADEEEDDDDDDDDDGGDDGDDDACV